MKKKLCMPINPKKNSCYGLKKIQTRNLITKKNCGPSLIDVISFSRCASSCFCICFLFRLAALQCYKQMRVSMTCQVFAEVLLALKPKYYNNIAIQLKLLCMYAPKVYDNA